MYCLSFNLYGSLHGLYLRLWPTTKMTMQKIPLFAGHFDCHGDAAVRCGAHCPCENATSSSNSGFSFGFKLKAHNSNKQWIHTTLRIEFAQFIRPNNSNTTNWWLWLPFGRLRQRLNWLTRNPNRFPLFLPFSVINMALFSMNPYNIFQAANSKEYIVFGKQGAKQDQECRYDALWWHFRT